MRILMLTISLALLAVASCNSTPTPDKLMDEANSSMQSGYEALDKMTGDLIKDDSKGAAKQLNKAIKHFDQATVYLAQAELPEADQPAVSQLQKGLDALEQCVKALEGSDMDKAQTLYVQARQHFEGARSLLRST